MPKYTLNDDATLPPTKLVLREGPEGSVDLVVTGGPENDEQLILSLKREGHIVRESLNRRAAKNLGLSLNDLGLMLVVPNDNVRIVNGVAKRAALDVDE